MPKSASVSRRTFLEASAATAAVTLVSRQALGGPRHVPPSERINVAYVGCGTQGLRQLMPALQRPDLRITAVCDPNRRSEDYVEWFRFELRDKIRGFLKDPAWAEGSKACPGGREVGRESVDRHYGAAAGAGCRAYADFRELLAKEKDLDATQQALKKEEAKAAALAAKMKRVRNGGQTDRYHHGEMGVNSRLDDIQSAILAARLPFLRGWTEARRAKAATYRRLLDGISAIDVPAACDPGHVYHLFPVLSAHRDPLQAFLKAEGIETLIHYPVPIPRQPALQSEAPGVCPVADRVCRQVLSLPLYPAIPDEHLAIVAEAVRRFEP